jgi:DNA repair exonuclease SbcCD ATPase subunit
MAFFTLGNLVTLAVVILLLIIFRQSDRGKRPLEMLRKYADKLKEDLEKYAAEKEEAVRGYGVSLDVEQQAARELMKRIQLTGQDLADKTAAMLKIDERIDSYDSALEDLVSMTARVEENLDRLRDESVFVEDTFTLVKGLRDKLGGLERDLGNLEQRFQRENSEAMEKTQEAVLGSLKSTLMDLEVQAETIETKVEDHRRELDKIDAARAEKLEKDEGRIRNLLAHSLEEAGRRADKLEDAALVKLRDQAQDRVEKFKTALEEKIKTYQETAKTRAGEMQELLKQQRSDAKAAAAEFAQLLKEQRQERQAEEAAFMTQHETIHSALALQEQKWLEVSADMDAAAARQEGQWKSLVSGLESTLETQRESWESAAARLNAALDSQEERVENSLTAQLQQVRSSLEEQKTQVGDSLSAQLQQVRASLEEQEKQVGDSLAVQLEQVRASLEEQKTQVGDSLAVQLEQARASLEEQKTRLEDSLGALRRQADAAAAAQKEELEAALSARKERIETEIAALADKTEAELGAQRERTAAELAAHKDQAEAALAAQRQEWTAAAAEGHAALEEQYNRWHDSMDEAFHQALEESEGRLDAYQSAQEEEFQRLALIADDASRLETALRQIMEEAKSRVRSDFSSFEKESSNLRQSTAAAFDAQVKTFELTLNNLRSELAELTETAQGALSEKFESFEDDFFADLSRRKADIDRRFDAWQETVDQRLAAMGEDALAGRKEMEAALVEESRKNLAAQGEKLISGLERLRQETEDLEAGIREQMLAADESRDSFQSRFNQAMEEIRISAESSIKVEIGRYTLSAQENIKMNQRDLEARLKEIAEALEGRNGELRASQERVRELAEENDGRLAQFRVNLDKAREEAAAQRQEILERTKEEARSISAAVEEAERRIKDFSAQTRLFERTDELKADLERRIEDLRGDIDRLDQRKSEIAQMEGEFVRIRRLGDEVGAKMNRFLLEQRRIEVMEGDFHRLIQISQAVEEKLTQVQDTDDILNTLQVQLRRLEDALRETEEKYQRIERKNDVLEETNNGIARNFKALQDSEISLAGLTANQESLSSRLEKLETGIKALAVDNEKALAAADKLGVLDQSLGAIEDRIKDMQKAREWLAGLETRMDDLYRQAQDHVKLAGNILNRDQPSRDSSITPALRENVLRLARQRWTKEAISNALKISQGEVELILEFATRDNP